MLKSVSTAQQPSVWPPLASVLLGPWVPPLKAYQCANVAGLELLGVRSFFGCELKKVPFARALCPPDSPHTGLLSCLRWFADLCLFYPLEQEPLKQSTAYIHLLAPRASPRSGPDQCWLKAPGQPRAERTGLGPRSCHTGLLGPHRFSCREKCSFPSCSGTPKGPRRYLPSVCSQERGPLSLRPQGVHTSRGALVGEGVGHCYPQGHPGH